MEEGLKIWMIMITEKDHGRGLFLDIGKKFMEIYFGFFLFRKSD